MRAIILAAGFGTRLLPLTKEIPKALVRIGGKSLLEILLGKLELYGFREVAINAHYKAEQIRQFITEYEKTSTINIFYSFEPTILNTGGGIKQMLRFFDGDESILVHNVDIVTDIDYSSLMHTHASTNATATLVVNKRHTSRPLAFKDDILLGRSQNVNFENAIEYGFCGIQVIKPELFEKVNSDNFYSIDIYEQEAKKKNKIMCYDITGNYWQDIGQAKDIEKANRALMREDFKI